MRPKCDFGHKGLVEDALAIIDDSGARQIVSVALAHAGWAAMGWGNHELSLTDNSEHCTARSRRVPL